MRFFLTGGSGFIGRYLIAQLAERGHDVTVLTRKLNKRPLPPHVLVIESDPAKPGPWQKIAVDHDVIINLAGMPIFRHWTKKSKKEIFDSRILATTNLVDALSHRKKEILFLSASGVGYYGFSQDTILEEPDPPGYDFLARVAFAWEQTALAAEKSGVRVVLCRLGIVLGRNGGALARLAPLFNCGLGAQLGDGDQWISWIHEQDVADIFLFLTEHPELTGPVNITSPHPVTNRELTQIFSAETAKSSLPFSVPEFLLRFTHGESADLFMKGQKVMPRKLIQEGYTFKFPTLDTAIHDLLKDQSDLLI